MGNTMSRRDEFAKAAMQGLRACSNPQVPTWSPDIAEIAVRDADALLAALGDEQTATIGKTVVRPVLTPFDDDVHSECCSRSLHNSLMHDKVAEIARLKAENERLVDACFKWEAELAKYTEPLTDEQMRVLVAWDGSIFFKLVDHSIRKVRAGGGE